MNEKEIPDHGWRLKAFKATGWEGLDFGDEFIPVNRRMMLFGMNSSGKSSFIRLLRLVAWMTKDVPWDSPDESAAPSSEKLASSGPIQVGGGLFHFGEGIPGENGWNPTGEGMFRPLLRDPLFHKHDSRERWPALSMARHRQQHGGKPVSEFRIELLLWNPVMEELVICADYGPRTTAESPLGYHESRDLVPLSVAWKLQGRHASGCVQLGFWRPIIAHNDYTKGTLPFPEPTILRVSINIDSLDTETLLRLAALQGYAMSREPACPHYFIAPNFPWGGSTPQSASPPVSFAASFAFPWHETDRVTTRFEFTPESDEELIAATNSDELREEFESISGILAGYLGVLPFCDFPPVREKFAANSRTEELPWSEQAELVIRWAAAQADRYGDPNELQTAPCKIYGLVPTVLIVESAIEQADVLMFQDEQGRFWSPRDVGKGILWIAGMLAKAYDTAYPVFEHPEHYLHPRAAADLAEAIMRLTPFSLFETHSEAILIRAQKLIRRGELKASEVVVLCFEKTSEGNKITHFPIREDGELYMPFPDGFAELWFDETSDEQEEDAVEDEEEEPGPEDDGEEEP